METPGKWGSWTHEETAQPNQEPEADMYGLYPATWQRTTARETSEANQHRNREANGGLGFVGYDESSVVMPSRPLSAGVAAVVSEVRLG